MYSIHVISWISCQLSTNIIHKVSERNSMKGKLHKMQSFVFLSTTLYFFKITFAKILSKMEVEEGKEVRNRKKGLWFWFYVTCSDRIFPLLLFLYSGNKLCPFFFFSIYSVVRLLIALKLHRLDLFCFQFSLKWFMPLPHIDHWDMHNPSFFISFSSFPGSSI